VIACHLETFVDCWLVQSQTQALLNSEGVSAKMTLDNALRLITAIRTIDPEMPLPQVHCFLIVANSEDGLSLSEIAKKANVGLATASRYIASLGKINRHREEGFQLIESFEDPMERRKKIIRLTTKGKVALKNALGENHANL
jgi:DNA-binding MarR family transcriptional regulator